MSDRKVSIIIPCYNSENFLEYTLKSVLAQSYSNWECIIVDDGSTDATINIIANFNELDNRFKIYYRNSNKLKGPSSCRNIGLEKATGDYIIFLDSDDLLATFCLQERLQFALENKECDIWIFTTKTFLSHPEDEYNIFNQKLGKNQSYLESFLTGKFPYCIMGPLWKREVLIDLKGFDEKLVIFEDPDLHIRAHAFDLQVKTAEKVNPDSFYRLSSKSRFDTTKPQLIIKLNSARYFFKKHLPAFGPQITFNAVQFFRTFILPLADVTVVYKFYFLFIKDGLFNFKQVTLLPLLISSNIVGITKQKGLGFYRLQKFIFKK